MIQKDAAGYARRVIKPGQPSLYAMFPDARYGMFEGLGWQLIPGFLHHQGLYRFSYTAIFGKMTVFTGFVLQISEVLLLMQHDLSAVFAFIHAEH